MNTDLFSTPCELRADLQSYVEDCAGFPMFKHPLLVSIYCPEMNNYINTAISAREEHLKGKSLSTQLAIVERPFRLEYLVSKYSVFSELTQKEQWELLSEIWVDSESPSVNLDIWLLLFDDLGTSPSLNSEYFQSLPDEITLYRGGLLNGLSWTGDLEEARWFANRFKPDCPEIWQVTIQKSEVIHFTDERSESEFIVSPTSINCPTRVN
ncbi:hypothetical protein [Photobacterium leiognathi]|uniref:hypothetical protein n=1 Tax=Photobacterium leiognathi TaxID=553611 RepID=UPI0029817CD7|nr:hypothetical protein [Photobacterium leiognathi]